MSDTLAMETEIKTEPEEKEIKPIVETKSSLEILSELFSTFDADPPALIEDESSNGSKKPKKKKKHKSKDKKHKKKSKKRKRSRSRGSNSSSSSEWEFDFVKLLVKQCESAEKKIKIEGTDLSLSLDKIDEKQPEEEVDKKPCIDELKKGKENEEGEISCEDEEKKLAKHKSKHKHKKRKSDNKSEKHSDKSSEDVTKSKHRHRSSSRHKSSKEKDALNEFYKNKDDLKSDRKRSRSPHKYTDLRRKIKENRYSESIHKDDKEYSDSRHKADHKSERHSRYDSDFYRGRDRDRSYDRAGKDDFYGRSRDDRWKRSRDISRENKYRDRRYSPDKDSSFIDKKKLLEIARKNAIQMMKSGSLPGALSLGPQAQEKVIAAIRAGGKTIEELTDFCKTLATKEDLGELSDVENDKGSGDSDNDKLFNHPFQIKDRPTTITMNIKNSVPLPVKSTQERTTELRMQFPVSSGQHHRTNENEWIPVKPKKDAAPPVPKPSIELIKEVVPITPLVPPASSAPFLSTVPVPAPVPPTVATQQQIDIGAIVSQRLTAMRKLQENPHDVQAMSQMYRSTKEVQSWAESKQQPGQFTGTVGGNFLSHSELSSGYQAWARKASRDSFLGQGIKRMTFTLDVVDIGKFRRNVVRTNNRTDQLQSAAPVSGGMGMHLLQKMGWKPGEGLGKEKTGALEPLLLEVKLDKKGLVATEESQKKRKNKQMPKPPPNPNGKHPVSLLGEYACKNKLGAPLYELCFECGPDHKKNFLFKVSLNGMEFQPNVASPNKKEAKANAALLCLQQLGIATQ